VRKRQHENEIMKREKEKNANSPPKPHTAHRQIKDDPSPAISTPNAGNKKSFPQTF